MVAMRADIANFVLVARENGEGVRVTDNHIAVVADSSFLELIKQTLHEKLQ